MGERLERLATWLGRRRAKRQLAEKALGWTYGMTPDTFHVRGRVMVTSTEGPRYDPNDFATVSNPQEVTDELTEILSR